MRTISVAAAVLLSSVNVAEGRPNERGWAMQGGNHWRTSAIRVRQADRAGESKVSYAALGKHVEWQYAGVATANPIVPITNGPPQVLIPDSLNKMRAFTPPEYTQSNSLEALWTFADSGHASGGLLSKYSGSPVSNGSSIFWVNWQTSTLWGINSHTQGILPWCPVDLVAASQNNHFKTWNTENSILFHDNHVWIPASDEHVAMSINAHTGVARLTNLTQNGARMLGSVGTTENNGHSVAFAATTYHMQGFNEQGKRLWNSNVQFNPVAQEFSHPVMIQFGDTTTHCIVLARALNGGLFFGGVAPSNGRSCAQWRQYGYTIRTKFTALASWVSAPAVIDEGESVHMYFGVVLPDEGSGEPRSALVKIRVDRFGPLSTTAVEEGYLFTGSAHSINMAPIIYKNAYGFNRHAVAVVMSNGAVHIFHWKGIGNGPHFNWGENQVLAALPKPQGQIRTAGNYAAASRGGSIYYIAYDTKTKDTYLVAISRAIDGPKGFHPTPAPQPAPANNKPPVNAAGAVFGTIGVLGALCAGIVWFAPNYAFSVGGRVINPADVIKGGASAVASGVKSVASMASSAVSNHSSYSSGYRMSTSTSESSGLLKGGGYGAATSGTPSFQGSASSMSTEL